MSETSLEMRSEAAVDHINAAVEQSDERGGRRYPRRRTPAAEERLVSNGRISIFSESYLLRNRNTMHQLELDDLRKFPSYLFDICVQPSATFAVTLDHFEYWSWTAAIAANGDKINVETGNFEALVHFASFPIRVTPTSLHPNPAIGGVLMRRWHLVQIALFSVLEGFLTNYIDVIRQTESGIKTNRNLTCNWAPDGKVDDWNKDGTVDGYNHLIQIWREYGTRHISTERTLGKINDIQRYDMGSIRWKFDDSDKIVDEELDDETYNFLRLITNYRNENMHGESEAYRVAPLLITLCCIAILDMIDESDYKNIRNSVLQGIRMKQDSQIHPLWPSAFYPLSTISRVGDTID